MKINRLLSLMLIYSIFMTVRVFFYGYPNELETLTIGFMCIVIVLMLINDMRKKELDNV